MFIKKHIQKCIKIFSLIIFIYKIFLIPVYSLENEKKLLLENSPYGICYDEKNENYFVSYIAGDPTKKNSNGYISRLDKDLKILNKYYIIGLNAPRGIIIINTDIIVCDLNEIKIYNIETNQESLKNEDFFCPIKKIIKIGKFSKSMVTDLCYVKNKNKIYAVDMLANKIISLDLKYDYYLETMINGAWLKFPLTIAYDALRDRLLIANFLYARISSIDLTKPILKQRKDQVNAVPIYFKTLLNTSIKQISGIAINKKGTIFFAGGIKQGKLFEFNGKELILLEYLPDITGDILLINNEKSILTAVKYRNEIVKTEVRREKNNEI